MRTYSTTIELIFPCRVSTVYAGLIDLSTHSKWNSEMRSISRSDLMQIGMEYKTVSEVTGLITIVADIKVENLIPNKLIELSNQSGAVTFTAVYIFHELKNHQTEVVCRLEFRFNSSILDLARPVIEGMAKDRILQNLERLRLLLKTGAL
jgi:hypothetical protein